MSAPDTSGPSDQELLARVAKGEAEAINTFYARWFQIFMTTALRLTGDQNAAEDIAQDAIVRVFSRVGQYRPEYPARSWLLTILRNLVTDWARRRQVRRASSLSDPAPAASAPPEDGDEVDPAARPRDDRLDPADEAPTAQERAEARERADAVAAALQQLSPDERRVIALRDFEGLSAPEAAHELGIDTKLFASRLFRARQRLAGILQSKWPGLFAQR